MTEKYASPTLVVNIKREYFAAILAVPRRKRVEYRRMIHYWIRRLEYVGPAPFNLRMLNGGDRPSDTGCAKPAYEGTRAPPRTSSEREALGSEEGANDQIGRQGRRMGT